MEGKIDEKNRHDKHVWAVKLAIRMIAEFLRESSGVEPEIEGPYNNSRPFDFKVNGLRVAVRVATPCRSRHTVNVGGKSYGYRYLNWSFNMHRHGKVDTYTDIFVLFYTSRHGNGLRVEKFFAYPQSRFPERATFTLRCGHVGEGIRPYRGSMVPYQDNWRVFLPQTDDKPVDDDKLNESAS